MDLEELFRAVNQRVHMKVAMLSQNRFFWSGLAMETKHGSVVFLGPEVDWSDNLVRDFFGNQFQSIRYLVTDESGRCTPYYTPIFRNGQRLEWQDIGAEIAREPSLVRRIYLCNEQVHKTITVGKLECFKRLYESTQTLFNPMGVYQSLVNLLKPDIEIIAADSYEAAVSHLRENRVHAR